MKRIFLIFILIYLFLSAPYVFAANYFVELAEDEFDGSTDCDGACDSGDTIIIRAGSRGNLTFQNFDGAGSYITITNENTTPESRVVITKNAVHASVLLLDECKYVDLRGDNDGDIVYGIKVINGDIGGVVACTVGLRGDCDNIKISYLEITCEGNTSEGASGIQAQSAGSLYPSSITMDTLEFHHNYIHDTRYAGMYIGNNTPASSDNPWLANVLIHDNLLEDMGMYGITLKGCSTGSTNAIYNNIVRRTGLLIADHETVGGVPQLWATHGIGPYKMESDAYVSVYNNWVEDTLGAGFKITDAHKVYNNICVNCGTSDDPAYGSAYLMYQGAQGTGEIYDNIAIQPGTYGVYAQSSTIGDMDRNLIGDAGIGESETDTTGTLNEGTGTDANIYYSDIASFNFNTWSDDDDYTNDRFRTRELFPHNGGTGIPITPTLQWIVWDDVTNVSVLFEEGDSSPDIEVQSSLAESYNPPTLTYGTTYYWQLVLTYADGLIETGAVYSFTTSGETPVNPVYKRGPGVNFKFSPNAGSLLFNNN